MHARCATPWTVPGCARRIACSRPRPSVSRATRCRRLAPRTSGRAGCSARWRPCAPAHRFDSYCRRTIVHYGRTTFSKFIIEDQRRMAEPDSQLTALLNDIQTACKHIASAVARGALHATQASQRTTNVQGEIQQPLDVIANDIMVRNCEWGGELCG